VVEKDLHFGSAVATRGSPCDAPPVAPVAAESQRFAAIAARTEYPVLLLGETGVGKTYLARLIHRSSARVAQPFLDINCAAVPAALFEREMFGHVRGAFTDAKDSQPGFVEAADRGTLFLDEISELPIAMQPKLLTVLEERRSRRLGSPHERQVDIRLIAATNRDLQGMVGRHEFREDLFHRCAVLEHRVPALRERPDDLRAVIAWLLARLVGPNAELPMVTPEAEEVLYAYTWPGNIRELDNALRHALAYTLNRYVDRRHLPERVRGSLRAPSPGSCTARAADRYAAPSDPRAEVETIVAALREAGGNRTRAARRLGMSRSTLWAKLGRYPIDGDLWASAPSTSEQRAD
jgi:DNA-binding NtrC family response regulator